MIRSWLADFFKWLFTFSFFRKRFYGIHQRVFFPLQLFKGVQKQILFHGNIQLELAIEDWIQENLFFLGEYENAEFTFLSATLKQGDVVIDIGANIGLYSLFAASKIGAQGKVISFEPFQKNYQALCKNVSLNATNNVELVNLAVAESESEIDLYYDTRQANLGMVSSYLSEHNQHQKVQTISIDKYLQQHPLPKIDFIKMDIEGNEFPALKGMRNTLIQFHPILMIEMDKDIVKSTPYTDSDIILFLQELGYTKYHITPKGKLEKDYADNGLTNFVFMS